MYHSISYLLMINVIERVSDLLLANRDKIGVGCGHDKLHFLMYGEFTRNGRDM